eukprot:scaffold217886_cov30-Tisochrysis_lutea.AAC.4
MSACTTHHSQRGDRGWKGVGVESEFHSDCASSRSGIHGQGLELLPPATGTSVTYFLHAHCGFLARAFQDRDRRHELLERRLDPLIVAFSGAVCLPNFFAHHRFCGLPSHTMGMGLLERFIFNFPCAVLPGQLFVAASLRRKCSNQIETLTLAQRSAVASTYGSMSCGDAASRNW